MSQSWTCCSAAFSKQKMFVIVVWQTRLASRRLLSARYIIIHSVRLSSSDSWTLVVAYYSHVNEWLVCTQQLSLPTIQPLTTPRSMLAGIVRPRLNTWYITCPTSARRSRDYDPPCRRHLVVVVPRYKLVHIRPSCLFCIAGPVILDFQKSDFWALGPFGLLIFHHFTKFGAKMLIDAKIMAQNRNPRWRPSAILDLLRHHIGPHTKSFHWAKSACQILW